jgi:hypothetical protein
MLMDVDVFSDLVVFCHYATRVATSEEEAKATRRASKAGIAEG